MEKRLICELSCQILERVELKTLARICIREMWLRKLKTTSAKSITHNENAGVQMPSNNMPSPAQLRACKEPQESKWQILKPRFQ